MRWLIVDSYYPEFLGSVYQQNPELSNHPFEQQRATLLYQSLGTSDFYSTNLRRLGQDAEEVIANCLPVQQAWAQEHGSRFARFVGLLPFSIRQRWLQQVLTTQIKTIRPDILYIQDINGTDESLLREARPYVRLILGQTAYALRPNIDYGCYDLILTSFPHYVSMFRSNGVPSQYLRLAFEPQLLSRVGAVEKQYGAVFVGGYTHQHKAGTELLEAVARRVRVDFWGYGPALTDDSPIRDTFHNQAWGLDMYRVLAGARIVINRHIGLAGPHANNMRLYETTGVGSLLLTDAKENLHTLFEPGREVAVYHDAAECADLITYYMERDEERERIALAGKERTHREHTYYQRMQELIGIVEQRLRQDASATSGTSRRHAEVVGAGAPFTNFFTRVSNRLSPGRLRPMRRATIPSLLTSGWQQPDVAEEQRLLVDQQLHQMRQGLPVEPFSVAAEAVQLTGSDQGLVLEVGCASGYYWEVLSHQLGHSINYAGMDYSKSMVEKASKTYPGVLFVQGDATDLPFRANACAVLLSGTVLLHVPEYEKVVAESARVAGEWCIFHRTPVSRSIATSWFEKQAYSARVVELVFNEEELLALFAKHGLELRHTLPVSEYQQQGVPGTVAIKTYVCKKL